MSTKIDQKLDEFLSNLGIPEPGTSKDDKSALDSALSDSDFDRVGSPVFSKINQKLPYTYQEDKEIIKYILKGQNIFKVFSIFLWKHLEAKKDKPKRSYQSLRSRFFRNIKPNLFTVYGHLIKDQNTVKKILIKFPELKKQLRGRRHLSQINDPEPEKNILKNSNSNQSKINTDNVEKVQATFAVASENFDPSILASSIHLKARLDKRTVKLNGNKIDISINLNESTDRLYVILPRLSERFKKSEKSKERERCSDCGRFYDSSLSELSDDSVILNSHPLKTDKNSSQSKTKLSERNSSHLTSSGRESSLGCVKKPYKSDRNTEESNNLPMDVTGEVNVVKIVEESPIKEQEREITDSISDLELFYDDAQIRFQKLIGDDEEKPLWGKCMKDIDFTIFSEEESLDSVSLDTPPGSPV